MSCRAFGWIWLACCVTPIHLVASGDGAEPLWEHTSETAVTYLDLTPRGDVLIGGKTGLASLDARNGSVRWRSQELKNCKPQEETESPVTECQWGEFGSGVFTIEATSRFALFENERALGVIDLETGRGWAKPADSRRTTVAPYRQGHALLLLETPLDARQGNLSVVDMATGETRWTVELPFTQGLQHSRVEGASLLARAVRTGVPIATGFPVIGIGGSRKVKFDQIVLLSDDELLLMAGKTDDGKTALAAVKAESGKLLWVQKDVPQELLQAEGELKSLKVDHYFYGAESRRAGESLLVVAPSVQAPGGEPFALDVETGAVKWRAPIAYEGQRLCGGCSIVVSDALYVMHDQSVSAINVASGSVAWTLATEAGPAIRLTEGGLLLGCFEGEETCYSNLELRRFDSGELAWPDAVQTGGKNFVRAPTRATVLDEENDRLLFASDKQLWALDLPQGLVTDVGSFQFDFREKPESILALREGPVVLAGQNIAGFGRDGGELYGHSFKAAKRRVGLVTAKRFGLFLGSVAPALFITPPVFFGPRPDYWAVREAGARAAQMAIAGTADENAFKRFSESEAALDHYFAYTSSPDANGENGYSYVQVRYSDGVEAARAWIGDRRPEVVLDPFAPMVYALRDGKRIVAIPFVGSGDD